MQYFFDTTDTIADGVGYDLYGLLHFCWLGFFLLVAICNVLGYRKLTDGGRNRWRRIIAWLLVSDEVFKMALLIPFGNYGFGYLPFHLCSINIFMILVHAYKPSKTLDNFLYTVCIPGAIAALLFPTWNKLPLANGMHLHSFTVHILLALYPIVLAINGDIKPDLKQLPKSLGLLVLMAIPIYGLNLLLDTNFMFLMEAEEGNPLRWFGDHWGNHLLGFPVIIAGVLIVMYGIPAIFRKLHKKSVAV